VASESALFDTLIIAYLVEQVSVFYSVLKSLLSDSTLNHKHTVPISKCIHYFIFKWTPIYAHIYQVVSSLYDYRLEL